MSYKEIRQIKLRIDDLISRIKSLKGNTDIELQSDLSKYLCVLISGYFEKSICEIIFTYGEKFSPQIARCIQIEFKWTTNIKMSRLVDIIEQFSTEWKESFCSKNEFDDYKDSLDYIVNNRNNISHGMGSNVTISELEYHYSVIERIIEDIKDMYRLYV